MKLDDRMIEKMSKKLAEIAKNKKPVDQSQQHKSNVKDYKDDLSTFSRASNIEKVQRKKSVPTNQLTQNSNEINMEQNCEPRQNEEEIDAYSSVVIQKENKKKQKDEVKKAISLAMKSRHSLSKNGGSLKTSLDKDKNQRKVSGSTLDGQKYPSLKQLSSSSSQKDSSSHQSLMPKVSIMNNLIKLSQKLTPERILAYMKTRSKSQKVSPIRLLTYFCVEKVMFALWNANGIQQMENKLKNPLAQKIFLCEQILKGVTDLLSYFKNLQSSLINKVLMVVFKRLGLSGLYCQSWLPSCVKANLKVFEKIGVNTKELLKTSKSRTISSNIFNQISTLDQTIDFSDLGLSLDNEQKSSQRIDELDSCNIQNKLFFYKKSKKQNNKKGICKKPESEVKPQFIRSNSKQKRKVQKLVPNELLKKKENLEQNINKNQIKSKNLECKEFSVSLPKLKCPWNAKIFTNQSDEKGHLFKQKSAKQMPIQNVLQEQSSYEVPSQKRTRPDIKQFQLGQIMSEQEQTDLIVVSKSQIKRFIQEHMFSNINVITSKIIDGCKINPDSVLKTIKQSTASKSQPMKMKEFQVSLQHQKKDNEENLKNKTIACRSSTRDKNGSKNKAKESFHSQNKISLSEKQLIALVEKTSFDLQRKGKPQQQIMNELFKILNENGVSNCDEKKKILNEWLKKREEIGK